MNRMEQLPPPQENIFNITKDELLRLDPEYGKTLTRGSIASTVYLLLNTYIYQEDFTKEGLINAVINSHKGNTLHIKERVEKTVQNFIDKKYLQIDDNEIVKKNFLLIK